MAYQVLARKWRPKTFTDLVGQEHVVKALKNALAKGRLHHAYLLTGTRGVGKTTIARILAKSLNCEHAHNGEPCGVCESCTQIDAGRYVDVLEIDAASNTGIDNIREVLENAQYAPTVGKYKVYIIDEVHMLSKSAFNAMLKTLEEPPEHVKFILATTDPHKVPVTVLSRCLQFVLRNMTSQQVSDHLAHVLEQEQIEFEPIALQLLGRAAAGSMRDALSLLDQAIAMGAGKVTEQDVRHMIGAVDKRYLYELLLAIADQNGEALLQKAQEMSARSIGFDSALSELAMLLQRLALFKVVPTAVDRSDTEYETLQQLAQVLSGEQIQLYYQCVIHGKKDLSLAPDEYAGFVMTLLRMLAFAPLAAPADLGNVEGSELSDSGAQITAKKSFRLSELPHETEVAALPRDSIRAEETKIEKVKLADDELPPWEDAVSEPSGFEETQLSKLSNKEKSSEQLINSSTEVSQESKIENENFQTASTQKIQNFDDASSYVTLENEELAQVDNEDSFYDDSQFPFPIESSIAIPIEDSNVEASSNEIKDDVAEDAPEFIAMPEFQPENWAAIVKRLSEKLGVAQMVALHSAWVDYEPEQQLIKLATTKEAKATINKERLDKICQTVSDAYGLALKLQTVPWRDEAGWETPEMRRKRIQLEGQEQAKKLLEQDLAAKQIIELFGAKWRMETLELIANQE